MARPIKKGIDYFPLDVSFLSDMKIRKIRKACGDTAITMLIYLLGNIYQDEGYYMQWDDDVRFLVADDIGTSESAVTELLNKAFKVKFFDKNLFDKYKILTSHGIQIRYQKAAYKKVDSSIRPEYSLISDTESKVSGTDNSVSDDRSTQRKEDESKEDKSRADERIVDNSRQDENDKFAFLYQDEFSPYQHFNSSIGHKVSLNKLQAIAKKYMSYGVDPQKINQLINLAIDITASKGKSSWGFTEKVIANWIHDGNTDVDYLRTKNFLGF